MKINLKDVHLNFQTNLTYSDGREDHTLKLESIADDGRLKAWRSVDVQGEDRLTVKVCLRNQSSSPLYIEEICLARFAGWQDISLGGADWRSYRLLCEGRHKNDIPTVCTLGIQDESWQDGAQALKESGEAGERLAVNPRMVSDSLTLLSGGGECVMLAFPHAAKHFVSCRISLAEGEDCLVLSDCPKVLLMPGQEMESQELWIVRGRDGEALIEEFAQENLSGAMQKRGGIKRKKTPAVYCTWYYYGLTVSYEDVKMNLEQIVEKKIPFDVFQIDEGWEKVLGWWEPNARFPVSMKEIAGEIRQAGLTPGLWTSPFVAHEISPVWKEHPEWCLRDKEGKPYLFPMNDTVYQVFDVTNPAVWEYIRQMYETFTRDWGYTYHKLDFTRAAILYEDGDFYDKTMPLPKAYGKAMEAVRQGIGEESYLLVCGGLYDPLIGIADAQRTGSDVLSMWKSNINKDGKTVPFTVKQNLLRFYMNAWWDNDPDALMLRRQKEMTRGLRLTYGLLTDEEVKTVTVNQYVGGGLLSSTEPLDRIDENRLWQLKHLLPLVKVWAKPKELFAAERFPAEIVVTGREKEFHQLVRINWDDQKEMEGSITADREGFSIDTDPGSRYLVSEFFSGEYNVVSGGELVKMSPVKPHGCAVYKIQKYEPDKAYIVGGTGHYSLGEETDGVRMKEGKMEFSLSYLFPAASQYRILLPEGWRDLEGNREVSVEVSSPGEHVFSLPVKKTEDEKR